MLTRIGVTVTALALSMLGAPPLASAGDGEVTCPPSQPVCVVIVDDPGSPGTGGTGGSGGSGTGDAVCKVSGTGETVPCYDPAWGWWSSADDCYYKEVLPPPPRTAPQWGGHFPNGSIYAAMCPASGGTGGGWTWFADPPAGYGGATPTPAALAQRAVDTMRLSGPAIGMAPTEGETGLVGLPVWLWTEVSTTTWGPTSATASVPSLSVTATARAKRIVWDMGNGDTVTCTGPGTLYTTSKGDAQSPTCGYVYTRSSASQPDHVYTVTATTTWAVNWSGGGQSGALTVTRSSTALVRIGELQVLVS